MADPWTAELAMGNKDNAAVPQIHEARDWAGSDDPANAENWPVQIRVFPTALVGVIAFMWYVQNHKREIPL